MRSKFDPARDVSLVRLNAIFDRVDADMPLRRKTLDDVVRVLDGEIKPSTVYRNLTRRIHAASRESNLSL